MVSGEQDRKSKNLEAKNKVLRARIEALEKKGGERAQGARPSIQERKWHGGRVVNGHGRGGGVAAKKLDEQRRKLQNELREIEKFSCLSKEVQERLKSNLQQQLQEVEQRRCDLMPEHQKVQKRLQKIQSIQDRRRNLQKESAAAQEEMRKIREEKDRSEERFRKLSDKVDKNKMVDAEVAAELQGLQAGEERRGSGLLLGDDVGTVFRYGSESSRGFVPKGNWRRSGQTSGNEQGRRDGECEQEQGCC